MKIKHRKRSQNKHPDKDIVVYPVRKRIVGVAGLSFFAALICLLALYDLFIAGDITSVNFLTGLFALVFFGFGFLYFFKRRLDSKPSLIINREGIFDNATAFGLGMIKWEDIDYVSHCEYNGQSYLRIIPYDVKKITRSQPLINRFMMKLSYMIYGSSIHIPLSTLPMTAEDLEGMIIKYRKRRVED